LKIFISGPSGVGKSTIINEVMKKNKNIVLSVSYTTRSPRPEEKDGRDYFFVLKQTFEEMTAAHMFLEWACVHNQLYGTSIEWVNEKEDKGFDVLFDIDVQGVAQIREKGVKGCFILVVPPNLDELSKRLAKRGTEAEKDVALRLENARRELSYWKNYDYLVVNDTLKSTITDIESIIRAYQCTKEFSEEKLKWLHEIG
jgi:guanylate kinase